MVLYIEKEKVTKFKMKGSHGFRRRTRNLRVKVKEKGKVGIKRYLQKFEENDMVSISINPKYRAIPYPKFQGRSGRILNRQGRAYYVEIKDGDKTKNVLITPEHLIPLKRNSIGGE